MKYDQTKLIEVDAISVRKGNFLKYKNQYFFYKKTVSVFEDSKSKAKKDKNSCKPKKPPR